jgi:hypothetical protein
MHPLFLDGVLSGDLTRRMYIPGAHGHALRYATSAYHALDTYPGIYLNVYCRKEYPTSGIQVSASTWAGFGLTPEEYGRICEQVRLYLGDSKASLDYGMMVDLLHNPTQDRDRPMSVMNTKRTDFSNGQRRFTRSERAPEVVLEWVKPIEDNISPIWSKFGHLDIPIPRCIMEVGWSKECQRRVG